MQMIKRTPWVLDLQRIASRALFLTHEDAAALYNRLQCRHMYTCAYCVPFSGSRCQPTLYVLVPPSDLLQGQEYDAHEVVFGHVFNQDPIGASGGAVEALNGRWVDIEQREDGDGDGKGRVRVGPFVLRDLESDPVGFLSAYYTANGHRFWECDVVVREQECDGVIMFGLDGVLKTADNEDHDGKEVAESTGLFFHRFELPNLSDEVETVLRAGVRGGRFAQAWRELLEYPGTTELDIGES